MAIVSGYGTAIGTAMEFSRQAASFVTIGGGMHAHTVPSITFC